MFNITKFTQIVSPVLLLASILLFNNLTLAAAGGAPIGGAATVLRPVDRALINAARDGDGTTVATALAAGADLNARDHYGDTALMDAALYGHTAIVAQLLAAGADVNASNNEGGTALINAAWHGHTEAITQLLTAGANVNTSTNNGNTALIYAAWNDHTATVTQLLAAGADVNASTNEGWTALLRIAWYGHTEAIMQLLAAGADVNVRDNHGNTALIYAAWNDHTATVTQLLAAGAEIPAELQTDATILAQPEALRNTPALLRALNSGYHKQVIKAITHSDIIAILMATDLGTIDFSQYKFIINPGGDIFPDLDLLAAGATRAAGEDSPAITPEEFSILDLAILSCQPALVDQLLMSGMSPAHLTQQTRGLLERFPAPGGGTREAKGAGDHAMTVGEVVTLAESEQIAEMIYYADMAQTIEVQKRVRGLPGSYNTTEPLPEPVERYAKTTRALKT